MGKTNKNKEFFFFLFIICFLTSILFWPVFIQNKTPLNANLLASFFNPWAQEAFVGWEHGIPKKPVGKDDLWIFFPQRTFSTDVLKNWKLPFWNPYSFSGNYHLGLSETAVFYPLNFLFLLFPQIDLWVFLIIIQPIIAGTGMYLFLKKLVSNEKSAILGSLAFAFSGIVIVRSVEGLSVGHTLIWMPYVFWGIESFFQNKKIRFLIVILFALSMSLLSGWFQFTFYIFILGVLYALFKLLINWKHNIIQHKKFNLLIFLPFFMLPLVTLFHLIPAFQALLDSPRVALEGRIFSSQHLVSPFHIFTLFIPDLWGNPAVYNYFGRGDYKDSIAFIGVIPLILSFISLIKKKSGEELFFLGAVVVSFGFAIDNPLSRFIVTSPIPVFSSFLPNRIFLISTFSFCVLSAYGLDYILNVKADLVFRHVKKAFLIILIIVSLFSIFVTFPIIKDPTILNKVDSAGINTSKDAISFKNSIIPLFLLINSIIVLFIFRKNYARNLFFPCVMVIFFSQSYLFAQKYIPFSNREFVFQKHPVFSYLQEHQKLDRFVSIGSGHIVPSIPLQFGLYSPEGIGSMYIRRYGEFVRYMKVGEYGIPDKIAFDLEVYPKEVFDPLKNRLNRFFELTSVHYIVVDKKSLKESRTNPEKGAFNLVWENEKWQIYQYKKSMPRFFTTSNYEIITGKREILEYLFSDSFNPKKIILEENPGFQSSNYQGVVKIINYSPNKITVKLSTDKPTLLYFSDNYSKLFKVSVNGKAEKMLRANYTFRAVPIQKGNHLVEFAYDTGSFIIGGIFSFITLIFFVSAITCYKIISRLKKEKRERNF